MVQDLSDVESLLYFTILQGPTDPNFQAISEMPIDMVIVSPFIPEAFDTVQRSMGPDLANQLKFGSGEEKLVIGYHGFGNIWPSSAEFTDYETQLSWDADLDGIPDANAPAWLGPANRNFPVSEISDPAPTDGESFFPEYYVKAWHPEWLDYFKGRIDEFAASNLDGLFLDVLEIVNVFSDDPINPVPGVEPVPNVAGKLANALSELNSYIQDNHPDFNLIVNASVTDDLFNNHPEAIESIDAVLGENQHFLNGEPQPDHIDGRAFYEVAQNQNKPIFTVEYLPNDRTLFEQVSKFANDDGVVTSISSDNGSDSAEPDIFSYTGGQGADRISGVAQDPTMIHGRAGPDTLTGGDDYDLMDGGDGKDLIYGQDGDDLALAGSGADTVYGNAGSDEVYGNQNNDEVYGNQGDDFVFGGQDADILFGGQNDDEVYGNQGSDEVYGNQGQDFVFGGQGADLAFGGQGADVVFGNKGADSLFGNKGDDELRGGPGDDVLFGGAGSDSFVLSTGGGRDRISDFQTGDVVEIALGINSTGIQSFADVEIEANADGDAAIDLGDGASATLLGIAPGELSEADFGFF